jgi:predicted amidohydrolase
MDRSATVTLALWATNLSPPLAGLEDWAARVGERMDEAAAAGARILVMPEYAAEQWLSFKPPGLAPQEEIAWMGGQAPAALALLRRLVERHGIAILAGTMPWAVDGTYCNRAWLLLPDGREIPQDKLVLTPGEKDADSWDLATGDEIAIVEWDGLRLATLICLDVEAPALVAILAPQDLDLVLVPSMTTTPAGYHRVFSCAKGRAVELMCAVAVTGCIGSATGSTQNPTNVSGAAVYIPCEPILGHAGIHVTEGPFDGTDGAAPLVIAKDVPIGMIRRLRAGDAEVWPGVWNASHVSAREA